MLEKVQFEIPDEIDEDDFESYFRSNIQGILEALDQSAYEHDERSHVDEIRISSIDLSVDSITVYYDVHISAYHGCRDANYAEIDERDVNGSREGRVFFFDKWIYPERKSTYDEF